MSLPLSKSAGNFTLHISTGMSGSTLRRAVGMYESVFSSKGGLCGGLFFAAFRARFRALIFARADR